MKNISVKRVYEQFEKSDGKRILVDRLWPRGITKEKADIDVWAKEITPSRELVAWFHKDKENNFKDFEKKYHHYLKEHKAIVNNALDIKGKVTLVTSVKDISHSHIPTLLKFIETESEKLNK